MMILYFSIFKYYTVLSYDLFYSNTSFQFSFLFNQYITIHCAIEGAFYNSSECYWFYRTLSRTSPKAEIMSL